MDDCACSTSTAAAQALALSGTVLVTGPDPKLAKATPRAFHHTLDGQTTLSSSGLCLDSLIICPASVVLPFLLESARAALLEASERLLIPGSRIEVQKGEVACPGQLRGFLEVAGVRAAVQGLLDSSRDDLSWGWLLGQQPCGAALHSQACVAVITCPRPAAADAASPACPAGLGSSVTAAVARLEQRAGRAAAPARGAALVVAGSPFGALSLRHFAGSVAAGVVSNLVAVRQGGEAALLLADVRCLPGCEGAPVLGACGGLLGVLAAPIAHRAFQAEARCRALMVVPVVIPARALARSLAAWAHGASQGSTPAPDPPEGPGEPGLPATFARPPWRAADAERADAPPAARTYAERLRDGDARRPPWSQSAARSSAHTAGQPPWRARVAEGALVAAAACGRGGSRAPEPSARCAALRRRESLAAPAQLPSGALQGLQLTPHACRSLSGSKRPAPSPETAAHAVPRRSAAPHCQGIALPQRVVSSPRLGGPVAGVEAAVAALAGAVAAVVGPDGAWASAVAATSALLVTNAHVLQASRRAGGRLPDPRADSASGLRAGRAQHQRGVPQDARRAPGQGRVRVRLPGGCWRSAAVVYVFQGPLDLAVLALLPGGLAGCARAAGSLGPVPLLGALQPAALCAGVLEPGAPVAVVGHALLHPRARLDAGVTAGVLARVVCSTPPPVASGAAAAGEEALSAGGAGAEPAMLLTTAPVYPGASGGAVVSACGRLAGLVTSNSRHAASGAPLPRLNYSIAAAALRPLWETLAAARYAGVAGALAFEAGPGAHPASPAPALHHDSGLAQCEGTLGDWQLGSAHAALAELQEQLRALDVSHPDLASLWALASPPDGPRPGPGEPQGEAGPPRSTDSTGAARLARLLDEKGLRQQLWLGEGRPSRSRL